MKSLDLFSGIGGFALGLSQAGIRPAAFVERDRFCRRVLAKNFPGVPIHDDVRTFRAPRGFADVVTGGFPCQPFSTASAGKRYGEEHDSFLWPEMLRIVSEVRPRWVVGENVIGIDSMALEQVVSDLEACGYEVGTFEIPACAVGHDHRRARVWICAHAHGNGKPRRSVHAEVARCAADGSIAASVGAHDGLPGRLDGHRLRALGNAVVPGVVQAIGRAILQAEAA